MSRDVPAWGYSKATVRVIRDRYRHIKKTAGVVTPKTILDDAKNPRSPLHRFFDWDDSSAAEKYRMQQASDLIRRVQVFVTRDGVKQPIRVYASVVKDDIRQYQELTTVLRNEESSGRLRSSLRQELEGVMRRYEMYKFCARSVDYIQQAIDAIDVDEDQEEAA